MNSHHMKLLVLTQVVDKNDTNLGLFHTWLERIASRVEHLTVICLKRGEYHLPENVTVLSLGKTPEPCLPAGRHLSLPTGQAGT